MSLELRDLRSFVAVATAGSITKAAENTHIAQPALSLKIKQIEEQVGAKLFDRTARGVKLTAAGHRLLPHALDLLKRMNLAFEDVRGAIQEPSGRVAIGLPQSLAKFLTVPLVGEVVRRWPKIEFQMLEMSTGYIPDMLARGQIDLGFTFGVEEGMGIGFEHLLDEELVFVTSRSQMKKMLGQHALRRDALSLLTLSRLPLILPTSTHSLRRRIDDYASSTKLSFNVIAEVNTIPQLIGLAAADIGSTILSYASVFDADVAGRLVVLRIAKPVMTRPVYLCKPATAPLSIATSIVREALHQIVKDLIDTGAWPAGRPPGGSRERLL